MNPPRVGSARGDLRAAHRKTIRHQQGRTKYKHKTINKESKTSTINKPHDRAHEDGPKEASAPLKGNDPTECESSRSKGCESKKKHQRKVHKAVARVNGGRPWETM